MQEELNEKLNKIKYIKNQVKDSLVAKGCEITDTTPFEDYPTAIDNLKSGGEKVFAYYNGTDIEAGKKILLTRTNNAMATDDGFMNGNIPYLINDGIAYCGDGSSSAMTTCMNIIDGKISESLGALKNNSGMFANSYYTHTAASGTSTTNSSAYTFVHSALGGKALLQTAAPVSSSSGCYACAVIIDNVFRVAAQNSSSSETYAKNCKKLFLLENFMVWCRGGSSYSFPVKIGEDMDTAANLIGQRNYVRIVDGNKPAIWFERKEDAGVCLYALFKYNSSATKWDFAKYTHETKTVETSFDEEIVAPKYDVSFFDKSGTHDTIPNGIYVQTKDYKYLLYKDYYVQVDYNNLAEDITNGIVVREYPEVIKNAISERTIVSIQTFYDNTFALSLSDGATLMCSYRPNAGAVDNDGLANSCTIEEIEPYVLPDDENIYFRHFTSDKMYWYLSLNRSAKESCYGKATAHPYQADQSISAYLAIDNIKERFNSTILTGFMTGETKKDDNGLTMIEVETTTGGNL